MNDLIKDCRVTGEMLFSDRNIRGRDLDVVGLRKSIGMVLSEAKSFYDVDLRQYRL